MADANVEMGFDAAIEHAKRAFALEKYEQAVNYNATALELITKAHGDDAPAPCWEPEDDVEDEPAESSSANGPILSFSGDAGEDAVDLFSVAQNMADEDAAEQDEEGRVGRTGSQGTTSARRGRCSTSRLKLADTYIALGDVSLETEKFDAAITDYTAALALKWLGELEGAAPSASTSAPAPAPGLEPQGKGKDSLSQRQRSSASYGAQGRFWRPTSGRADITKSVDPIKGPRDLDKHASGFDASPKALAKRLKARLPGPRLYQACDMPLTPLYSPPKV
ncbi:hypothetical protein DFH07DRAFT_985828 [Mycena maculata]|uniref:Tetratricopeptide SHNi-TPR domain-containing protein n=1 Tax=Mycena maculata TaxID=230809 RepID=A0AAD7I8A9_9AGAR|nr:hypothetical protein DFH07DRAFT_985828 [Mycena maculata]